MLNSRFKSWDCDNFIKKKLRHEASFPIDLKLMVETEQKKKEKIPLDQDNWKELWNSISKQLNIEILN